MSITPKYDAKVKAILDDLKPGEHTCELSGKKWDMSEEEIGWYKKLNVPPSKLHPRTRWYATSGFFVENQWWWNKHAETGEPVLTGVHPATGLRVLPDEEWFDKDFSEKGTDYQTDQPFFDQFRKLQLAVPTNATRNFQKVENSIAMGSGKCVNSYFVCASEAKNSFFTLTSIELEGTCMAVWSDSATDCFMLSDSSEVHSSKFVIDSYQVLNSQFVCLCKDVADCFFVTNQSHKRFMWKDEQLTEEEYKKRLAEIDFSCRSKMEELAKEFYDYLNTKAVWPERTVINSPDCTGEYLIDCNNLKHSFGCVKSYDSFWVSHIYNQSNNDAFCSGLAWGCDYCYQSSDLGKCSKIKFGNHLVSCLEMEYCTNCYNCEFCFGCVGLNHKKYHIFNKEYSEEEYWTRVDELKCAMLERGEYGDFFPLEFAPGYYKQGGPTLYMMAEPEELEAMGALQFDPESEGAVGIDLDKATDPIASSEVPDCFPEDANEWVGKPILDESINRRYSFIQPEIDYYKKHQLPLPTTHFTRRVQNLSWLMNAAKFEQRECGKCNKSIEVAMNKTFPDRIVYCMDCYFKFSEERG